MADSKAAGAKNGIISHMNKGHTDSLIRYLEHYHKLSGWRAYNAQMTDIDLHGFDVKASGKVYRIPFHPAMGSLSEARERLVEMDRISSLYLKKSPVTIKRYVPPYGLYFISFVATVGAIGSIAKRDWYLPGGAAEQLIAPHVGADIASKYAQLIYAIQPRLFYGLLLTHLGEMIYFMRYKLVEHSVSARQPAFWLWAISVLIEGAGAQSRFKREISRVEKEKLKAQH